MKVVSKFIQCDICHNRIFSMTNQACCGGKIKVFNGYLKKSEKWDVCPDCMEALLKFCREYKTLKDRKVI